MQRLRPFRAALACCAALLTACSGGGSSSGSGPRHVVRVGVDLPLSGADASVGRSTLNGMLLAFKQASATSGPDHIVWEEESLDDAVQGVHSPQQGVANIKTLVSDDTVLAVLGPYNSNVAAAEIPVTNAAGLAQVAPSTVSDGLTLGADAIAMRRANPTRNTFFRVCTTDSRQGSAAAIFARQRGFKRAYIVDDDETYGLDLANVFESDFQKGGGTVLGHDHIAAGTEDFKSLLTKIVATKPDLVYFGGTTSTGAGLIRQQMFDIGLGNVAFMGGDGIPDIALIAGARADGTFYTLAAPNAAKLPSAQAFIKAYEAEYHEPIGPYSANGYAAAQVVIAAVEAAMAKDHSNITKVRPQDVIIGLPTRAAVVAEIAKSKDIQTPIGPISFDANGDVKEPVISLYTIVHGAPVFISQVNLKQ